MSVASRPVRLPKNYQAIYEIMRAAGHGVHLTTNDVFLRAKRRCPKIGFSTVYRGVRRLRDLKLIDEIVLPGSDSAVYELMGEPHAHFHCDRCGRVQDVAYRLSPQAIGKLSRQTGAQIDEALLTLHGSCGACLR
jgi:Fe2+ or Zn2+ uptake regulation protein